MGWVGFASDGKHAFSTAHDGTARLWDLGDGREVRRFHVQGKWANCGAVFPDGRRLLTGKDRGLLQVWDVATGQEIKRLEAGSVLSLSILSDGRHALVAGSDASVWDLETGERLRVFQGHDEGVFQAALSPDGKQVLTASFDGKVRLWDFQTAELLRVVGSHDEYVFSAAFSPYGKLVASGGGGRREGENYLPGTDHDIRIWDLSAASAEAAAAPHSRSKGWLAAVAILGMLAVLAFLGAWLWARRADPGAALGAGESGPPDKSPTNEPPVKSSMKEDTVSFPCPACGRSLRVRTERGGKKVKCPQCGKVVLVPETESTEPRP